MKTLFYLFLVVGALFVRQSENLQDAGMLVIQSMVNNVKKIIIGRDVAEIRNIDTDDFYTVTKLRNRVVLVSYWDEFSPASKTKTRAIEREIKEFSSKVLFCKVAIGENPDLAKRMSVNETPTVFVYYKGEMMREYSGDINPNDISKTVSYYVDQDKQNKNRGSIEPLADDWLPSGVHEVSPDGGQYTPL